MGKGRRIDSYRKTCGKWKKLIPLWQALAITIVVAFLFYKSVFGLAAGVLIVPFWLKLKVEEKEATRRGQIAAEFKEYMMLIVAGLQTG